MDRKVLDKIKTEITTKIDKRPYLNFIKRERECNNAFFEALDIIDRYRKFKITKQEVRV